MLVVVNCKYFCRNNVITTQHYILENYSFNLCFLLLCLVSGYVKSNTHYIRLGHAMTQAVVGFSLPWPMFSHRSVHMCFVMDNVEMSWVFLHTHGGTIQS
jgi:hypothetical protein